MCTKTAELEYSAGDAEQMLSRGINNHQSGRISFLKSKIIPECTFGDEVTAAGASLSQGGVWGGWAGDGFGFWVHSQRQRGRICLRNGAGSVSLMWVLLCVPPWGAWSDGWCHWALLVQTICLRSPRIS